MKPTQNLKPGEKLVRLKPRNPKKGLVMSRYTLAGVLYRVEAGWYVVGAKTAKALADVKARPDDPDCEILAFNVCTYEEAVELEEREALAEGRAAPDRPHRQDLSTEDLRAMRAIEPTEPSRAPASKTPKTPRATTARTRGSSEPPPPASPAEG